MTNATPMATKKDFIVLFTVDGANPNGNPCDNNQPRTDNDGYGLMTAVCCKRKIRNRAQDMGLDIFVQSEDRTDDGYTSLSQRVSAELGKEKNRAAMLANACSKWFDVRAFGQVFAFKDKQGASASARGPVTIRLIRSVDTVPIESMQITKSCNAEDKSKSGNEDDMASDRMGMIHVVGHGLYMVCGSINARIAERTGFSEDDAQVVKECLRTLFMNDASAARPDGSMEVIKLYWFDHNTKDGQYPSAKVHRTVSVERADPDKAPRSIDDYVIHFDPLDGLKYEVLDGE